MLGRSPTAIVGPHWPLCSRGTCLIGENVQKRPIAIPLGHWSASFAASKPAGSFVPGWSWYGWWGFIANKPHFGPNSSHLCVHRLNPPPRRSPHLIYFPSHASDKDGSVVAWQVYPHDSIRLTPPIISGLHLLHSVISRRRAGEPLFNTVNDRRRITRAVGLNYLH